VLSGVEGQLERKVSPHLDTSLMADSSEKLSKTR
jgi:hypothetical protein